MKNSLFIVLIILCISTVDAQTDGKVVIGTIDSMYSNILKEERKVWVYIPNGLNNPSKQRFPVVYLLDGSAHFFSVVGLIQQFSQVNGNTVCPEMIVVGINNTDRTRDLTPTHVAADPPYMDSAFSRTSGGGEQFLSYIEKELIPHIDSTYPTQPYRMMIGHSFGGLMAIHTLVNRTRLFNAYIAIDPSMWWENMGYLQKIKTILKDKQFSGTNLYLGYANTLEEGMDIQHVTDDTSAMSRHIRAILSLDKVLGENKGNGLIYQSKYYSGDSHTTVPLITEYDALRHIFRNYQFKLETRYYTDPDADLASKYQLHYAQASQFFGYKVLPSEYFIDSWADEFLTLKHFKKAEKLYALNVAYYPESASAYEALGDFYTVVNNKSKAIESFKKAIAIRNNEEVRKKLEALLK